LQFLIFQISSNIKEQQVPNTGTPVALKAVVRDDTTRRAIEVDGRASTADPGAG